MPRVTPAIWAQIRAEREAGASLGILARHYGLSRQAISKRAIAEGWASAEEGREITLETAEARLAGMLAKAPTPEMDAAADRIVEVTRRHRQEWHLHREKWGLATDPEDARAAKVSGEMLMIRQKGERVAWGMDRISPDQAEITIVRDMGLGPAAARESSPSPAPDPGPSFFAEPFRPKPVAEPKVPPSAFPAPAPAEPRPSRKPAAAASTFGVGGAYDAFLSTIKRPS